MDGMYCTAREHFVPEADVLKAKKWARVRCKKKMRHLDKSNHKTAAPVKCSQSTVFRTKNVQGRKTSKLTTGPWMAKAKI